MSSSGPRREVAYRVFADEFNDATHTYAESDEERAPNYLVTPTGARVNRLFVVGVLTEVEEVSDDVVRARVVDPTGAFVIYAGQYQPDALAFFERADPPAFVAVTGKARTFQPEGSDRVFTSIRPETVNEVDAETRDRWVVQTAEHTLERVAIFGKALDTPERGSELEELLATGGVGPGLASGIPRAIEVYGTTSGYLNSIQSMAVDAARLVADEVEAVEREDLAPDEGGEATLDTSFADDIVLAPAAEGEGEAAETAEPAQPGEPVKADVGDDDAEAVDPQADQETEAESVAERTESETVEQEPPEPEDEPDIPTEPPAEAEAVEEQPPAGEEEGEVTDEMYELSEEERKEVKEQYDVEFESGAEIGEPESETTDVGVEAPSENGADEVVEPADAETGAVESQISADEAGAGAGSGADVETEGKREESLDEEQTEPEGESAASVESEAAVEEEVPTAEEVPSAEPAEDETTEETAAEAEAESDSPTEEAPLESDELEDAVIETMKAEGGSDGIERGVLIEHVESRYGVEADEIEEAIQDALLGGRCFESGEDRLKPI